MPTYTAFIQDMWIATGSRDEIVATLRTVPPPPRASDLLVFDDASGRQIDFDLRESGEEADAPRPRGRPSLGVVAREVTLLPRHWDWLAAQPGGASAVLRRLVDEARKRDGSGRAGKDAAYHFLSAIAGDRPRFEEATRALYADDRDRFAALMADWPVGIRNHALALAFGGEAA
ncbi:hypothetical protein SAMN06295912_10214 [Sphingomonas laterariae]|uniref:DUF2239 domain-containing protein n=1 Tax=Edaphosphingomonas laterariae TaxID=861865 RepID=A0A239C552_9SPHN|nr:DUF2239 family protein [Sphingomonas laterariae]SNS15326.1 hypothetical protein SAMN06295912_10214 [Sphingomonas laterariae]